MIFGECPEGVDRSACLTRDQLEGAVLEVDAVWSWAEETWALCGSDPGPAEGPVR